MGWSQRGSMGERETKEEGGLGVRDFKALDEAATIKDTISLWENNNSAWARWMDARYIKGRGFEEIMKK